MRARASVMAKDKFNTEQNGGRSQRDSAERRVVCALQEPAEVLAALTSTPVGISSAESTARLERFGLNQIAAEKPLSWPVQLALAFHVSFNYLLITLAVVAWFTGDHVASVIISVMVLLSGVLRFWQEYHSGLAAQKLRELVHNTATVIRPELADEIGGGDANQNNLTRHHEKLQGTEVPFKNLVVGDVIKLSAGDLVPADARILSAKDLFVSQSTLTGESVPVEKYAEAVASAQQRIAQGATPLDLGALCFMGTTVVSGSARAVIVATGDRTYLGSVARHVAGSRPETAFDRGVRGVSWLLIRFMLVMVPVIFLINGITKGNWGEAFLFGVAVAVGLTPEMMPMIVTANLARGALAMSGRKVIVKKLPAIQNLGAMDILCTDKTGTLTQDKVVLIQHLDANGKESEHVLELAYLNSYFQTGLKSLLDEAVLNHEDMADSRELTRRYIKYDEVPFDFQRRRMSVVVHQVFSGRDLLICKGAVEEMLAVCEQVEIDEQVVPITDSIRAGLVQMRTNLNDDGLRVIAVAMKDVSSQPQKQYAVADESQLVLIGFIAFLDPPKESAAPALKALAELGVSVKILTGDNELVARKVCRDVGLNGSQMMLGGQIDALGDEELSTAAEGTVLFAKLNPLQKARIIAALKRRGHTVGFLGDGINDAPALRAADASVSVDSAADIAKESADIILLEKSLMVLEEGVELGRRTYGNTIKYIKMAASSNFGNVFSVLVASIWLPFLPMLAIHLLIQNLLYDISQIGIPFDRMDKEYLRTPRKWQINDLARFMVIVGPISSIFDITTFLLLFHLFGANTVAMQSLFHSGWFVEGLLSQTLIIHMIRTTKIPFLQSVAAPPLWTLTICVMVAGIMLPFTWLGETVGLAPLPMSYFPWLAATLIAYCVSIQLVKLWYVRRFGEWL